VGPRAQGEGATEIGVWGLWAKCSAHGPEVCVTSKRKLEMGDW